MCNELHPFTGYEVIIFGYFYEANDGISYIDQIVIHKILNPVILPNLTTTQMK
jgi:hypothetical protein